jgi:predicted phosphodiesterase
VSGLADYLPPNESENVPEADRRQRGKYPTGWEPRVTESHDRAEAVSNVFHVEQPNEVTLLEGWRMDPEAWAIVEGSLLVNRWQTSAGDWCFQYKARLERRVGSRVDVDELLRGISRHKPPAPHRGTGTLIIAPSDWQVGKADGDGTEGTVRRIVDSTARLVQHVRQVRPGAIVLVGLGDLLEGCDNHYASQTFTVQLDRRQQMRVVRRLFRDMVIKLSKAGVPMVVSGVAGNHGENRKDGKAFTGPGDNDDVAVVEQVGEVLAANPEAFGHVRFHVPDDRLAVLLEVEGWRIGFHHGHIAGRGSTPQQKQQNWWKDHAFMLSPVGEADLLVTGHYHHLSVVDHGPRVHFQAPAMDGGSRWWEDRGGGVSATGTLTFMVSEKGWDHLRVL